MATNILSAIRACPRLHGNVKFTALEIAHLMNSSGYGRVAYQYMAYKTGYSRRTAIRHMHKLIGLKVYEKTVYKLQNGYAINLYKCLLPRAAFYRDHVDRSSGDKVTSILPPPKTEEGKELSLAEEIQRLEKGLRFLSNPQGEMYQSVLAKIASLEGLQRRG